MIRKTERRTLYPCTFFFQCDTARRDLHSFPTRRSSDLEIEPPALAPRYSMCAARRTSSTSSRSEEHTSELQSRLHLVCRLLLEKKKKSSHYLNSFPLSSSKT